MTPYLDDPWVAPETGAAPHRQGRMGAVDHDCSAWDNCPNPEHRKPATVQRQVRIRPDLWATAAAKAHERGRSLNSVITELLEEWLDRS